MDTTLLERLHALEGALSPNERKMAKICVDAPHEIVDQSIHSIARMAGVSASTVSRMATKLGYSDWKDMRLSVARDMVRMDTMVSRANPVFSTVGAGESDMSVVQKLLNTNIASLCQTYEWLDGDELLRASRLINESERLVFFGCGGSGYVAHDEALRFSHLKLSAEAYSEPYQMLIQSSRMRKGQVAVGICNSGRTRLTVAAIKAARANGAAAIGISNFRGTPLERVCDVLFTTAPVHSEFLSASLTPRLAVLFIMDSLYCLAAHHGRISESLDAINQALEENLRESRKAARRREGAEERGSGGRETPPPKKRSR